MKTAERTDEQRWIVDVEDVRNLENGLPGYRHRFIFVGEDAALDAWTCAQRAETAGFKARPEKVKRV